MENLHEVVSQAGAILGAFLAAVVAGAIGYFVRSKPAAKPDATLTGIGLELGNRAQMDQLITAINRIGDIMENKRQTRMEEMLEELADKVDAKLAGR